jgi:hypothetical protein
MGTLLESFILPILEMKNSKFEAIRELSVQLANLRADVQVFEDGFTPEFNWITSRVLFSYSFLSDLVNFRLS